MVRRRVCPAALRPSGAFAPAGLGPELVPGVEVLEVLPTISHLAVLELEDDAVGNIEVLALSVRGAALDADHAVIAICGHVLQLGPEGSFGLLRQLAEVRQRGAAALVVAGHRAPARQVPHSLIHEVGERVHVAGIERLVSALHDRYVLMRFHDSLLLAVCRGWFLAEPVLLEPGAAIAGAQALALTQHSPCSCRSTRLICRGGHGRPLSAPLTEHVTRKARRAEGSPSDYDRTTAGDDVVRCSSTTTSGASMLGTRARCVRVAARASFAAGLG